jgi:hypothetical protein
MSTVPGGKYCCEFLNALAVQRLLQHVDMESSLQASLVDTIFERMYVQIDITITSLSHASSYMYGFRIDKLKESGGIMHILDLYSSIPTSPAKSMLFTMIFDFLIHHLETSKQIHVPQGKLIANFYTL